MTRSIATVRTANASRYLQQLCKHWAHKFAVDCTPERGTIALPFGTATLTADAAALTVVIETAAGADVERARHVVAEHLNRFAFREGELVFEWRLADDQA